MDQIVVMPMQWAAVADLNEVEALSEADVECMKEVAAVLQKFGKSERFAVHLVHKHFEVADDEVLCEFTDTGNRVLTTKPVKRIADSPMVETTWLLKESGNQVMQKCYMACYPVEGAQPPHQFRHSGQSGPG